MQKKIKLLGMVLFGLALVALGYYQTTKGIEATLLEVQPETMTILLEEEGKIVPAVEYSVPAIYGGKITKITIEEGQRVQAGDLLATIDATELKFQLQQIQGQLKTLRGEEGQTYQDPPEAKFKSQELLVEQALHDLKIAENELNRVEQLYNDGAMTAKELEEAKNRVELANILLKQQQEALALLEESHQPTQEARQYYEGRTEALNAQANLLRYQIQKCSILSPINGIIANLAIKEGNLVNPGFKLMNVFQEGAFLVETYVPADSLQGILPDMKVQLVQARKGEDLTFEGTVEKIAPAAVERMSALGLEEQRVKITIKPVLPSNSQLLPGTTLDVEFVTNKQEGVLAVPKTALFSYKKGDALWLVENDKAKIQPVTTGFENDSHVVITHGLESGDIVILNPQTGGLKEGKKVTGR